MIYRRRFLSQSIATSVALFSPYTFLKQVSGMEHPFENAREQAYDVVIVGGGLGGCSAALAALQSGLRVLLTEETDWIGGQLTQQAVPPDEHRWIETTGCNPSYREFRNRIREYYRRNYPLTDSAKAKPYLNPGNGSVSPLCHEPRVALAVLHEMLGPWLSNGRLTLALETRPSEARVGGDRIESVCFETRSGHKIWVTGSFYIDATEQGDLLPMTKTEYQIGSEAQSVTQEPHAASVADPKNIQSFVHCFAIDYLEGEDHTIDRPRDYTFWRDHVPNLRPAWSGKLLSLSYSSPRDLKPKTLDFVPETAGKPLPKTPGLNLWMYRRLLDPSQFTAGAYRSGISLVNWPQNDYMLGNIVDEPAEVIAKHLEGAKQLSLSWLYWLQTEAPRLDGGQGWKGLRLRHDIVGTEDGLAKYPYIRESRRIQAEFTILEQHIAKASRVALQKSSDSKPTSENFADSVGIGYYHLDLHPSSRGDNYIDFESLPFQIPLGALIPRRMENLLASCKNIGTTHISNGCYRLHPVEWGIGEAAGRLVAFCMQKKQSPKAVRNSPEQLSDFQAQLVATGIELSWKAV